MGFSPLPVIVFSVHGRLQRKYDIFQGKKPFLKWIYPGNGSLKKLEKIEAPPDGLLLRAVQFKCNISAKCVIPVHAIFVC